MKFVLSSVYVGHSEAFRSFLEHRADEGLRAVGASRAKVGELVQSGWTTVVEKAKGVLILLEKDSSACKYFEK